MSEQRSWPELQEELARKALEVIGDRNGAHPVLGELTDREQWLIADAVYDTITGLVPWDVANIIYQVRQELGSEIET